MTVNTIRGKMIDFKQYLIHYFRVKSLQNISPYNIEIRNGKVILYYMIKEKYLDKYELKIEEFLYEGDDWLKLCENTNKVFKDIRDKHLIDLQKRIEEIKKELKELNESIYD